jgi:hypothetical protein
MDLTFLIDLIPLNIGLISNIIGLITILLSKKLVNIGTKSIYMCLFIVDTLFLVLILIDRISYYYDFDLLVLSPLACRLYPYVYRIMATLSPMLLVYISIEKYLSLEDISKKHNLRNINNQLIYLFIIITYNAIFYSPSVIYFSLVKSNQTITTSTTNVSNDFIKCLVSHKSLESILPVMDLMNRVILPCILMTISTIFLIVSVNKSRFNFILRNITINNTTNSQHQNCNNNNNNTSTSQLRFLHSREHRFAVTSITLNSFYIVLTLPLPVMLMCNCFAEIYLFSSFYLFCLSYSLNFYILFIGNKLFRNEFLKIFCRGCSAHDDITTAV